MATSELNLGTVNIAMKQFSLALLVVTLVLMSRIVYMAKYRKSALRIAPLAPSIFVYLYFHIIGAAGSIPYNVHSIVMFYWQVEQRSALHIYAIYWIGQWQNTYNAISPLVVLFLTIERCISLRLPGGLSKKEQLEKWLLRFSALAIGLSFVGSTAFYLAELPLDVQRLNDLGCETVSCLMLSYRNLPQLFFKGLLSFANIGMCIFFLVTLRSYGAAAKQIRNRSVIITILFEALFNILPTFISIAFNFFGEGPVSNVVSMTSALDACCCAIYYFLIFLPNCIFKAPSNRINQQRKNTKIVQPRATKSTKNGGKAMKQQMARRASTAISVPKNNNFVEGMEEAGRIKSGEEIFVENILEKNDKII